MKQIINQVKEEWKEDTAKDKILAILGGIDVTFYIFSPIVIGSIWISSFRIVNWSSYFIFSIGLLSTLFRAYKIGWLK